MRKINKQEPDFFTEFVQRKKPISWNDCAPIRSRLRNYILKEEQNCQCAYTEVRIDLVEQPDETAEDKQVLSYHIDHYRKRDLFPRLTYSYDNLLVASNRGEFGAKYKDNHIKKNDYEVLINPVNDEPNFTYNLSSGEIKAPANSKEKKTVDLFNLNHKILIERRQQVIEYCYIYKEQGFKLEDLIDNIGEFESLIRFIYKH